MKVRDFRPGDFEQLVECYRAGFPEGHNRYSLSRLVRFQRDSILVAEHDQRVIGVIIGITSVREVWLTGLSVLPEGKLRFHRCSMRLIQALGNRFVDLGFTHALATTGRRSVNSLAKSAGAELLSVEQNFYFDGEPRWIYKADVAALQRLNQLLPSKHE